MSLPIYSGIRNAAGHPEVYVTRNGERTALPHLLRHSVDGFEWGFTGSGPRDLARSIVGNYLNTPQPNDRYTDALLTHVISHAGADGWTITPVDLHDAFRRLPSAVQLGRVSITRPINAQLMSEVTGDTFVRLCLLRHETGDWGVLDDHDNAANTAAQRHGGRLLSNFPIPTDVAPDALKDATHLWIITEAEDDHGQRPSTTVLYPTGY